MTIEFKPFDEMDWQSFAGCETEPVVCYLDVTIDSEPDEMAAVIDTFTEWEARPAYERIGLYCASGRMFTYDGSPITDRAQAVKMVSEILAGPMTSEGLIGLGFSEL